MEVSPVKFFMHHYFHGIQEEPAQYPASLKEAPSQSVTSLIPLSVYPVVEKTHSIYLLAEF